jgi:hypothetical protein
MVSPARKSSTLEAGGSSTLFNYEEWVSLLKEYLWFESILSGRIIHFMKSPHFRWNGERLVSYGTIQRVRVRSVLHLVSLWMLSYLLKGILPTSQCFHVWGTSTLCKIAPFKWMEQALFLFYENYRC